MPLFVLPLLIPYYTDRQASMRIPFATFGLMLLCLMTLVGTFGAQRKAARTFAAELDNAVQYALRSPAVDRRELQRLCDDIGRPDCIARVEDDPMRETAAQLESLFGAITGAAPEEDPIPVAQQAELDRRVARAREAYLAMPYVRFGLTRADFHVHALVTHLFLHAGLFHLLANLLFLWLAMSSLESVWGRWFTLAWFVVGGIVAGAFQLLFMGAVPLSPAVGASGAVAALMGAYLVRFVRSRIRMWYLIWFLSYARTGTFEWPAWVALPLWLAWHLAQWAWLGGSEAGYAAHVGGFALGALGALAVALSGIEARFLAQEEEEPEISPLRVQADSAAQRGEWATAARLYRTLADSHPYDDDLQVALARALAETGDDEQADAIFQGTIRRLVEHGNVAAAAERYQQMGQTTGSVELAPEAMVTIADWFAGRGQDHYALYTYERYLDFHPDHGWRLRALIGCLELLQHQREGREQAEQMLAEAEEIAARSGTGPDRQHLDRLRAALHQVPQGPSATDAAGGERRRVAVQSDELARNVDDWVQSPAQASPPPPRIAAVGGAPAPAPARREIPEWPASLEVPPERSPWGDTRKLADQPWEDYDDGDEGRPRRAMSLPAAGEGDGDEALDAHPWTPPGRRDPAASGEWDATDSKIIPPMDDEELRDEPAPAGGTAVPEALRSRILTPRLSALTMIEPDRLRCETGGGAPFKLPLEHVTWVAVGRIWYEEDAGGQESYVCDLVHGVHRTSSRVVVESVRLLSDRQPYGLLLQQAGMDEGHNFRRLLDQLRPVLHRASFIPPKTGEEGGDVPTFAGLDEYERAMMYRIVGER